MDIRTICASHELKSHYPCKNTSFPPNFHLPSSVFKPKKAEYYFLTKYVGRNDTLFLPLPLIGKSISLKTDARKTIYKETLRIKE